MQLNEIKERLQGKSTKYLTEEDIPEIHDILMVEYGWIPVHEFRELPMSTLWSLLSAIKKRKEREQKEAEKSRKKR